MTSILIFRTDRIGDFLVISPIFSSIKRNFRDCKIDIVCSPMNFKYINSFKFFNNVFLYPNNFLLKFKFFFNLKKYDYIFVTDGKKRSIYISIFKSSKFKFLFTPSVSIKRLFNFFFNKIFLIDYSVPKIKLIEDFLKEINCDLINDDINFILNNENSESLLTNKIKEPYIILNFDEKWISDKYINTYDRIEPSLDEFNNFTEKLSKKYKLIIVNGYKENRVLNNFKSINKDKILIKDKIDIFEFQTLIKHSNCLITCHGAPSHIASNYNIKIIDIIDKSELIFFESYNFHFKNKVQLFRESFYSLSSKILNSI